MSTELEALIVRLQMDAEDYLSAIKKSRQETDEFEKATKKSSDGVTAMGEKIAGANSDIGKSIGDYVQKLKWMENGGTELQKKFDAVQKAIEMGDISPSEGVEELNTLQGEANELKESISDLDNESQKAGLSITDFKSAVDLGKQALGYMKQGYDATVGATITYAREVDKLSQSLNISTEEASKLLQIGDDLKIENNTLEMAFRTMLDNGIQPTIENLKALATKYQSIQDPVQKAQFAMDAFGQRAGQDMQRLLALTGDKIDDMAASAEASGLVMSGEAVDGAIAFDESLDQLQDTAKGMAVTVGTEVIPILQEATDFANDSATSWQSLIGVLRDLENGIVPVETSYENYSKAVDEANKFNKIANITVRALTTGITDLGLGIEKMSEEEYLAQQNAVETAAVWAESDLVLQQMTDDVVKAQEAKDQLNVTYSTDFLSPYIQAVVTGTLETSALVENQRELIAVQAELKTKYAGLTEAQASLQAAQQSWMDSTAGDVVSTLETMGVKGDAYKEALGAIDDVYGTDLTLQQQYKDDLTALVAEYKKTGDVEAFKTKLSELKDTYMPLNEQVKEALELTTNLNDQIRALKSKEIYLVTHLIETTDPNPYNFPDAQNDQGTNGILPEMAAEGADFVVPGGFSEPDNPYWLGVESGEHVTVTPSGQAGGGTMINVYVTLPTDNPALVKSAARTGVLEAMRAKGQA